MGKISDYRTEFYDRNKLKGDNPRMYPPPRKPNGKNDLGLAFRPGAGLGMGGAPNTRGAYPLYRTADALEYAVNAYFGLKIEQEKPPTMAGLALALGFKSAKSLKDYENRGEAYSDILEVARTRMEEWKNELLLEGGKSSAGVIFDLKNNHGWSEKAEQRTTLETGDTLSQLLFALQGTVLRPAIDRAGEIEDADYRDVPLVETSPSKPIKSFADSESELGISLPRDDEDDLI